MIFNTAKDSIDVNMMASTVKRSWKLRKYTNDLPYFDVTK